ncbi:MAG: hypothetical protein U0946_01380, partial [Patescibacteria group bacterium]|nr:hypothetical protein [Patescibacteria group bacterium]
PTSKLHVVGDIRFTGGMISQGASYASTWMKFDQEVNGNSLILGSGGLTVIGGGESADQVRANVSAGSEELYLVSDNQTTNSAIRFVTNLQAGWASRVDAMTILGNGNVGIGTTGPGALLHINSSTSGAVYPIIQSADAANSGTGLIFRTPYSGTSYDGAIYSSWYTKTIGSHNVAGMTFVSPRDLAGWGFKFNSQSGTTRMFIDTTSGNVGIGTTGPGAKLHIENGTILGKNSTDVQYTINDAAMLGSQGGTYYFGNDAGPMGLKANNTEYVTLTTTGNVGIGTTNPTQKLHVEGQCITGDSLLPIKNRKKKKKGEKKGDGDDPNTESSKLYSIFQKLFQKLTSFGRSAQNSRNRELDPSSNRDIEMVRIDQIKGGELVYSLNEATGKLEPQKIKGLLDMGVKPVYKLTTADGKTIRTTGNHPYLTKNGWTKVVYLKEGEEIAVAEEKLFAGTQTGINHNSNRQSQNSTNNIKDLQPIKIQNHTFTPFANNKLNVKNANINPTPNPTTNQLNASTPENKGVTAEAKNTRLKLAVNSDKRSSWALSNKTFINSNSNTGNSGDVKFVKILSIEAVGEEQVWDIEVENTHNFVANGIIAHNTYISGNVGIGTT